MINKIFVSYRAKDTAVKHLPNSQQTNVNDYVAYMENKLARDIVHKGFQDNDILDGMTDDHIFDEIKYRILDSTLTIVLISPNMKDQELSESSQWIPWEILYSLTPNLRFDKAARANAVLAVILPDKSGNYSYYNKLSTFKILSENIRKGYIPVVKWRQLAYNFEKCIQFAFDRKERINNVYRWVE